MPVMPVVFLFLALVDALALAGTLWLGLSWEARGPRLLQLHMLAGLVASVVTVLTHSTVIFHVVGLGRSIKEAQPLVDTGGRDYYLENRRLAGRSHPLPVLVCLLAVVTPILGQAANLQIGVGKVHFVLGAALLALHVLATPIEVRNIVRADRIARELEALLEAKLGESGARPSPGRP